MIYVVTYDLFGPAEGYEPLFEALKKQGDAWSHYLRNTWLISTYKTPDQITAEMKPYIGQKDRFLIVRLQAPYQGWLPKDAWDWVHKYEHSSGKPAESQSDPTLFPPVGQAAAEK